MSVNGDYIVKLESENDELRERVRQLQEALGLTIQVPLMFGLTGRETDVFALLMKRDFITKAMVMESVYGHQPDAPEIKVVDVFICKIRKKIEPFGVEIETVWGQGYMISVDTKAKVNAYLRQSSPGTVQAA